MRFPADTDARPLALVDADCWAYAAAYMAEPHNVERRVNGWWERVSVALERPRVLACFGDAPNKYFRRTLCPTYKANRPPAPPMVELAREVIKAQCHWRTLPTLEADDVIGVVATHPATVGPCIIVGDDKDLLTIPGTHYNVRTKTTHERTEDDGDYCHMYQTLAGDSGDGYGGCPKVGPIKAHGILTSKGEVTRWEKVVAAFVTKGLSEADALLQARLARITRAGDYDIEAGAVKLWSPVTREAVAA